MFVLGSEAAKEKAIKVKDKDSMRKMIIYDKVRKCCGYHNECAINADYL